MNSLSGKVAIVTGAGQGIGKALALFLAKEGAKVIVNDLGTNENGDIKLADAVTQEIKEAGGEATANYNNVAGFNESQKIVEQAINNYGKIDVLVNNAGIVRDRILFKMSESEWDSVIAVSLKGSFNMTRAAAEHFKAQNSGRVINFTSTTGLIGNVGQANYAAAKAGVVGLTRSTALDMARFNVTANVIAPFAWSRMSDSIPADTEDGRRRRAIAQMMTADHIAPLVAYLASDLAGHVSGQIFCVRGKEIMLFSQPRPIKTAINLQGWTVENIDASLMDWFKGGLTQMDTSPSVFSYKPVV
ncbi:MAG: SDR family NAD(P)-dependent oxidoreductase [Syntrophomonas sp.]|nr:SDR family NAD(P)-dependent oxidoreductase [Syntrophomonas sp.]